MTETYKKPFFSCLCCTYGRPDFIGESVQSFLNQTYDLKELVIVNTCPRQEYVFKHPQVRVVNLSFRPSTHCQAMYETASHARGSWFVPWDDDDIWMPDFLSQYAEQIKENPDAHWLKPNGRFMGNISSVKDYSPGGGFCHLFACSRIAYTKTNGYLFNPQGGLFKTDVCDQNLLSAVDRYKGYHFPNKSHLTGMIYRWGGINYHHSATGGDKKGYAWIEKKINEDLDSGKMKSGIIEIKPNWSVDWVSMAEDIYEKGIQRSKFDTLCALLKEAKTYIDIVDKTTGEIVDGHEFNHEDTLQTIYDKMDEVMEVECGTWSDVRVREYLAVNFTEAVGRWSWDGGIHGFVIDDNYNISYYDSNDSIFDVENFANLVKVDNNKAKVDIIQRRLPHHLELYRYREDYFELVKDKMQLITFEDGSKDPVIKPLKKIKD